jgi:hypothetical protein
MVLLIPYIQILVINPVRSNPASPDKKYNTYHVIQNDAKVGRLDRLLFSAGMALPAPWVAGNLAKSGGPYLS